MTATVPDIRPLPTTSGRRLKKAEFGKVFMLSVCIHTVNTTTMQNCTK